MTSTICAGFLFFQLFNKKRKSCCVFFCFAETSFSSDLTGVSIIQAEFLQNHHDQQVYHKPGWQGVSENAWMSFDEFVEQNPGLPIDVLKHALHATDSAGKRLIPHLGITQGDIYVVSDASVRLMQFAESGQQFSNIPKLDNSIGSQTEVSNDSITFGADFTSEQGEMPNLPLNTTAFSTVPSKEVTKAPIPPTSPFEEKPEQQAQVNELPTTSKSVSQLNIKEFIQNFSAGDKPKVIAGYKGLSIKASRKNKTIQLRENKNDKYFELITYDIDHYFTDRDIETITKAHERFRDRIDAKMPWKDKTFLLNGTFREIKTFNQLFELYKEGQTTEK